MSPGFVRLSITTATQMVTSFPQSMLLGVDLETTGLDPRSDRPRLLSIQPFTCQGLRSVACGTTIVVDLWSGDGVGVDELFRACARHPLVAHNANFDLQWWLVRDLYPDDVYCTLLMTLQTLAGERGDSYRVFQAPSLAACAQFFTGVTLEKTEQKGNWSRPVLTAEQLAYAAKDVQVLPELWRVLVTRLCDQGQAAGAGNERRALPAIAWISAMGVPFDPELWAIPYREAVLLKEGVFRSMRETYLTDRVIAEITGQQELLPFAWDSRADKVLNSHQQVKRFLETVIGREISGTSDGVLAAIRHEVAGMLRDYRQYQTIERMFSPTWGRKIKAGDDQPDPVRNGRIYPRVFQYGAQTGRMSLKSPNIQQVPSPDKHPLGGKFRAAFRAPNGRVLVKADYSQIELRIAAEISGDTAMQDIYQRGGDIHTEAATWVLGTKKPTKHDRTIMKSANFGLLYGAGVTTFRSYAKANFGIDLSDQEAADIRARWFQAFPGIRAWHQSVGRHLEASKGNGITTRTLGGRILQRVMRYSEALNSPVQGTGADLLKSALARLYRNREQAPCPPSTAYDPSGWFPVLVVHDEIVLECPSSHAEAMADWLRREMIAAGEGLLAHVPIDASASFAQSWGK